MTKTDNKKVALLLTSVFIISICSIIYELLISSVASYFQGSSILHFSIVIGLFLSFMGIGSYLSKFIKEELLTWFVRFEAYLSLVGGLSSFILYFAFSLTPYFYIIGFFLLGVLGILIGLEIPILTRIMRKYDSLKDALANVMSFDYLGALIASIIFPLILLPLLGTMRTAFLVGLMNLAVALTNTFYFKEWLPKFKQLLRVQMVIGAVLLTGFIFSYKIIGVFDQYLYRDEIVFSKQTPYQQVVVTKWQDDFRLFINGSLQFSSKDEYRYHEALIHVPMSQIPVCEKVIILGGGDGLATRELLKYPDIQSIEIVDLDPAITDLAKQHPIFTRLNENSFQSEKVRVTNADAYKVMEKNTDFYDLIIVDLPDPSSASLGKLYTKEFYSLLSRRLSKHGVIVSQSTSPYFAKDAFWCIHNTMDTVFQNTIPYNVYVPTFGLWGFNMASNAPIEIHNDIDFDRLDLQFLNEKNILSLPNFGEDDGEIETDINKLDNQILIHYYEKGWNRSI